VVIAGKVVDVSLLEEPAVFHNGGKGFRGKVVKAVVAIVAFPPPDSSDSSFVLQSAASIWPR
jgi:hypothetical protein